MYFHEPLIAVNEQHKRVEKSLEVCHGIFNWSKLKMHFTGFFGDRKIKQ